MTAIRLSLVNKIADFQKDGKTPWITLKDNTVQEVYVNRDAARAAKTGKPSKYDHAALGALDLINDLSALPTAEAVADKMIGSDEADFAADKAADVVVPDAPSVAPIPPVAATSALAADKASKVKADVRHQSEIIRPTKRVWGIADEMTAKAKEAGLPVPSRKEVMAECDRQGIAYFTARTQYQVWKQMQG